MFTIGFGLVCFSLGGFWVCHETLKILQPKKEQENVIRLE